MIYENGVLVNRYIANGLEKYINCEHNPWHMPGHKRKQVYDSKMSVDMALEMAMAIDVTEVPGTDDLHHPEGMIRDSLDNLASVYGTYASYYLVNGSTCGILAAISACCRGSNGSSCAKSDSADDCNIIVARNCHKSVYNAVELLGLKPVYIYPEWNKSEDVLCEDESEDGDESELPDRMGFINPDDVEKICSRYKGIRAMVITSPTYEGVVSDIENISAILKKYNITLIVDEAHGAHLPFMPCTPKSAIYCGADIVVQSLHKTLPSLTQTAVLHVMNEGLNDDIRKYLSVFMSSSPSYIFLCSMERVVAWASQNDYDSYLNFLKNFRERASKFNNIKIIDKCDVVSAGAFDYDETRIVITAKNNRNITGTYLEHRMAELGNIVAEMSGKDYVVLISTAMDDEDDFDKLYMTLKTLDEEIGSQIQGGEIITHIEQGEYQSEMDISETDIMNLVGTKAKDNVYVYPPGSYILTAGEMITRETAEKLVEYVRVGKKIRGRLK